MTRRALLMSSGANRGAYYAGFMGPMSDAGLSFDLLAGVSAGGIAASWFAAGDEDALMRSWREADGWRVAFHPWLDGERRRTVDQLLQQITLEIMDLEAALSAETEVRVVVSRVVGGRWPMPRLERRVLSSRDARDTEQWGRMLRATAFVPWINGCTATLEIDGERYLDGGLTGRIPLDVVPRGVYDEIWLSACSPSGLRELEDQLSADGGRAERLIVLTPSQRLPVGRWTLDWDRVSRAIDIGRRDMQRKLTELGHR